MITPAFTPYAHQKRVIAYLLGGGTRAACFWHRRAGKDLAMLNVTWVKSQQRVGAYYYFYPTYAQAKKAIWLGMDEGGKRFLDYIPAELVAEKHETELRITMKNGSIIQFIGCDNIDSIMSTNPVGCVFSEYALQDPAGWKFVSPILRKNGGWAVFVTTPRGHNHAYDLYMNTKDNPNWFVEVLTIEDTGLIDSASLEEERISGIPEELIQQEYYCSFSASVEGSYFGADIVRMQKENRYINLLMDSRLPVHTAWDFGVNDYTAIWYFQYDGRTLYCVDYFEDRNQGFTWYVKQLREKPYVYGTHLAPHDVVAREFISGESIAAVAPEFGLHFTPVPRTSKVIQVQSTHMLLSRTIINKMACSRGFDCLGAYEREWDAKNKVHRNTPKHNWACHGADAFMQIAIGLDLVEIDDGQQRAEYTGGAEYNPLRESAVYRDTPARQRHLLPAYSDTGSDESGHEGIDSDGAGFQGRSGRVPQYSDR